jgi:hypothetical protein
MQAAEQNEFDEKKHNEITVRLSKNEMNSGKLH